MKWEFVLAAVDILFVILLLSGCGEKAPKPAVFYKQKPTPGFVMAPDGKRVVLLANDSNLYLLNLESGTPTQLTQKPDVMGVPRISPDGTKLLYSVEDDKGATAFILAGMDGAIIKRFDEPTRSGLGRFSPDGKKIVYSTGTGLNSNLAILDLETGARTTLTVAGNRSDRDAKFFPDGTKIVFLRALKYREKAGFSGLSVGWYDEDLYTINIDGTNERQLTQDNFASRRGGVEFLEGGKRLAISKRNEVKLAGGKHIFLTLLYTLPSDGSAQPKLFESPPPDLQPNCQDYCMLQQVSPDGTKILFTSDRTGIYTDNYWVMNINDSSSATQVSFDTSETIKNYKPRTTRDAVFTPDSQKIIYRTDDDHSLKQILADGKVLREQSAVVCVDCLREIELLKYIGTPSVFLEPTKWTKKQTTSQTPSLHSNEN